MFRILIVPAALLAIVPGDAHACRCPPKLAFKGAYDRGYMVVTGKVSALKKNADGSGSTATIAVTQAWKAQAPQILSVSTRTSCAFNFVEGEEYLLYLYRTPDGGYYTSKCVGDLALAKAGTALTWLKHHGSASPSS